MGIAWGLRGDKNIYTLCVGLAWGSPHKVLSSGVLPTQSPRKVFPVGIAWGEFAWVSETGVPETLREHPNLVKQLSLTLNFTLSLTSSP